MTKVRLSYSLLKTWIEGKKAERYGIVRTYNGKPINYRDEIVNMYLRTSSLTNPAINRGIKFDKYVAEYVKTTKCLPPELGGTPLVNPIPKMQIDIEYDDQFDLKGEIDIWANRVIYEVKNSPYRDSADYADDFQITMYLFMAKLHESIAIRDSAELSEFGKTDRAVVLRFNPYKKEFDKSIVYMSERRLMQVVNIIDENGPEIKRHLISEGIL